MAPVKHGSVRFGASADDLSALMRALKVDRDYLLEAHLRHSVMQYAPIFE